jgi:hypothetical protein
VNEESADELVCGKCHLLVSISALDSVVLPLEGDAVFVECDQAAIGDGNPVGIAREIGQHRLGSAAIGHNETNPVTLTLISTFWMDLYIAAHKSLEAMIV